VVFVVVLPDDQLVMDGQELQVLQLQATWKLGTGVVMLGNLKKQLRLQFR
jgi:hypothetical protein